MKRFFAIASIALFIAAALCVPTGAQNNESNNKITLAVFGDWPYSTTLLNEAPLLINSINSDPKVRLVVHVGDIHSGSMPCTGAGLNPPPPVYAPLWNIGIFNLFEQFKNPVVYTPGDNEWTDCHKRRQGNNVVGSGAPMNELAAVRNLFFANPGLTLGVHRKRVESQAEVVDQDHPTDAQFVENVMWKESQVVFVTLNVPGSNNDGIPWTAPFTNEPARTTEVEQRNGANLRWLERAFEKAETEDAKAVLIALQADMWDPAALVPGGDGLSGYTTLVQKIADLAVQFDRPVLLINGDSHVFEADQPLADPNSSTGVIHHTQAVPNLFRITVEGSTAADEWVRLTIDPHSSAIFSWDRIQYLP